MAKRRRHSLPASEHDRAELEIKQALGRFVLATEQHFEERHSLPPDVVLTLMMNAMLDEVACMVGGMIDAGMLDGARVETILESCTTRIRKTLERTADETAMDVAGRSAAN